MSEKWTFGFEYNASIPYSSSWGCPHCQHFSIVGEEFGRMTKCVVGISEENVPTELHSDEFGNNFIVIIECPKCFKKFWFHVNESWVIAIWRSKDRKKVDDYLKNKYSDHFQ